MSPLESKALLVFVLYGGVALLAAILAAIGNGEEKLKLPRT